MMSKVSYRKAIKVIVEMNKVLGFVLLALVTEIAVEAIELPEHLKGPAKILRKTCQAETNVPEELIEKSKGGYLPDDKSLQCYIDCLFRTVGMYDDAGNIVFEEIYHLIPADFKEKFDKVTAKCKTIHGANKCETAWLTVKCYFEADPEHSMLP